MGQAGRRGDRGCLRRRGAASQGAEAPAGYHRLRRGDAQDDGSGCDRGDQEERLECEGYILKRLSGIRLCEEGFEPGSRGLSA